MSNLGGYQTLTTMAKKVGGPRNLVILIGAGGATVYGVTEFAVKKGIKMFRSYRKKLQMSDGLKEELYEVDKPGVSNEGLGFEVGDKFRILEKDGDAVLIEKLGDDNNPYFVSEVLLKNISSYEK